MRAGRLRHLITFEELVNSTDSDGALVETWVPAFNGKKIWAEINYTSGREIQAADAVQVRTVAKIRIRFREGVKETMRIRHQKRSEVKLFNIESILFDSHTGNRDIVMPVNYGLNQH